MQYSASYRTSITSRYASGESYNEIAADTGLSIGTIWRWAVAAGVARSRSEGNGISARKYNSKKRQFLSIQPIAWKSTTLDEDVQGEIISRYKSGKSTTQIGKDLGISPVSVYRYCSANGIIRPRLQALRDAIRGDKNWNWRGGMGRGYRGSDWGEMRRAALERDGFSCQHCGSSQKTPDVHHIIPYRLLGTNELHNLVSLCKSCHASAERNLSPLFERLGVLRW